VLKFRGKIEKETCQKSATVCQNSAGNLQCLAEYFNFCPAYFLPTMPLVSEMDRRMRSAKQSLQQARECPTAAEYFMASGSGFYPCNSGIKI